MQRPETIDEAIDRTVRITPDHVSRHEVERMLWKFIETLTIYDGPVTIYPDKKIDYVCVWPALTSTIVGCPHVVCEGSVVFSCVFLGEHEIHEGGGWRWTASTPPEKIP